MDPGRPAADHHHDHARVDGPYVDNNSGVGANTATFSNLTVNAVNMAPVISATASGSLSPVTLDGIITDDNLPDTFTSQWSQRTGPTLSFANATLVDTTATLTGSGAHGLRLPPIAIRN